MLPRAEEEGAVDERVPVKDVQRLLAQRARDPGLVLPCQGREDKQARVVVAMVTLVLNLEQWKKNALHPVELRICLSLFGLSTVLKGHKVYIT